jgi:hypothetical protein
LDHDRYFLLEALDNDRYLSMARRATSRAGGAIFP